MYNAHTGNRHFSEVEVSQNSPSAAHNRDLWWVSVHCIRRNSHPKSKLNIYKNIAKQRKSGKSILTRRRIRTKMAQIRREIRRPTMILLIIWLMKSPLIGKFNHNNRNAQVNTSYTTLKRTTKIDNDEPPTMSTNDDNVRKNDVAFQPKIHTGVHLYQR